MLTVEHMFLHYLFVWMSKPCESVVLYSGLYRLASLSDVHLARLTRYAVYPRSPQSQVIFYQTKESGDPPRRQANTFYVFGQHYAEPAVWRLDIWKKSIWGGLLFQIRCCKRRVEGTSYLLQTISIFQLVKDPKCEQTRLSSSSGD